MDQSKLLRVFIIVVCGVSIVAGVISPASLNAAPFFNSVPIEIVPNIPHASRVSSIAFSPDGEQVVSGGGNTAKLWGVATGRLLRTFIGHSEGIKSVAFSPDGRSIASGGEDETVRLWDIQTGRLIRTFVRKSAVIGVSFSSDTGNLLVGDNGSIDLIDIATGRAITAINDSYITAVAVSRDGSRIISGNNFSNSVKMWDSSTGKLLQEFKGRRATNISSVNSDATTPVTITSVTFSSDGTRVMAGSSDQDTFNPNGIQDHVVNVWDVKSGKLLMTFSGHSDSISAVALSTDGKRGCSGSVDGTIKIWDVGTGTPLQTITAQPFLAAVAFSPDGKEVLSGDGGLKLWDIDSGKPIIEFGSSQIYPIDSANFSPTGANLVAAGEDSVVSIWDLTNGALRQWFIGGNIVRFLPDGKRVLSAERPVGWRFSPEFSERLLSIGRGSVRTWDALDGRPLQSFGEQTDDINAIAISHDGRRVLLSKGDKPLELWDIASTKLLRKYLAFSSASSVAFSPDDQTISASVGPVAKFWDTESGKSLRGFTPFPDWGAGSFTFSHDGKQLIFGGSARASIMGSFLRNLKLVDALTGRTLQEFVGHSNSVNSVALSHDDARVLSGSGDGTVRLWESSSGKLIYIFSGSQDSISAVEFSPDGRRILAGSADGAVRLWNIETGELLVSMYKVGDRDWLTITPEGFFVSSAHGAEHLSIVQGLKVLGINQVYQSLYRPDLVREKLAGDPRGLVRQAAAKLNLDKVIASGEAPAVKILSPRNAERPASSRITVQVEITARGGGIGRVEWRINGITVGVDTPKTSIAGQSVRLAREISAEEGDNTIDIIAYNAANLVGSAPAHANITAPAPTVRSPTRMFVLAIGLNKYSERRLNLTYAVPDAEAIAQAMRATGKGLYADVETAVLSDDQVNRDDLEKAISALASKVKPTDVFVFYIAGHGKTVEGHYYFIPQNFRFQGNSAASLDTAVVAQGIAQDQWQSWFSRIPAARSVLMFDTCEAGTLTQDATLALEQSAASARIAQATGRNILTASAGDKEALEGFRDHGLFTYSVLEALDRADSNGDGKIDVSELAAYVHAKVQMLSEKIFKQSQVPQINIAANYPFAQPARVLANASPDLIIADKPTDVLASKTELLVLPAVGAREVRLLPEKTALTRVRSVDGWTLVATHGQPIGYVATKDLAPLH